MPAAVLLLRDEVRVLDDAAERHRRVPDVQPVVRGERAVELEDRAERVTVGDRAPRPAHVLREVGREPQELGDRDRREDEVERLRPAGELHVEAARGLPHDPHRPRRADVPAARLHAGEHGRDPAPERPLEVPETLAEPGLVARARAERDLSPQPHEAHVVGAAPVLLGEERAPDGVERPAVAVAAHPARRRVALEAPPVRALAELQRRQDELQPAEEPERREGEEGRRRPEVPQLPAREESHPRLQPEEVAPEAELLGEGHVVDVAREEVVVVPLERRPAHLHDAHEAAGLRKLLEDRDGKPRAEEAVRRDEPGEAAADHGDTRRDGAHAPSLARPGRAIVLP